jgi:hypothetical protein
MQLQNTTLPIIEYYTLQIYGTPRRYILNPDIAALVYQLTQRKTLFHSDMNALSGLGLSFVEVLPPQQTSNE